MDKIITLTTLLLLSGNSYASVNLEKPSYKYECSYSTTWEQEDKTGEEVLIIVHGEVNNLSELKGKQEVVLNSEGNRTTLVVGKCTVEI